MLTGGGTAVEGQLKQKYESEPALRQKTSIDPDLMAYVAQVWGE